MNHLPFIIAAYAATALILGGLALASWLDFRRQKRLLGARNPEQGGER
jgi:heme exporter protein CcmD